jgi:ABC-type lipoprotein release transport system permease subunit
MVLTHAGLWSLGGVAAGLVGALLAGRALESLLYNIGPADVRTLAGAAAGLLLVVLFAAWLPSRRAARVDPTRSLRQV